MPIAYDIETIVGITFNDVVIDKINNETQKNILKQHNEHVQNFNDLSNKIQGYEGARAKVDACDGLKEQTRAFVLDHFTFLNQAYITQLTYAGHRSRSDELNKTIKTETHKQKSAQKFQPTKFWPYYWKTIANYFDHITNHVGAPYYYDDYQYPEHFDKIATNWVIVFPAFVVSAVILAGALILSASLTVVLPLTLSILLIVIPAVTAGFALSIYKALKEKNIQDSLAAQNNLEEANSAIADASTQLEQLNQETEQLFQALEAMPVSMDNNPDGQSISAIPGRIKTLVVPGHGNNFGLFAGTDVGKPEGNSLSVTSDNTPTSK